MIAENGLKDKSGAGRQVLHGQLPKRRLRHRSDDELFSVCGPRTVGSVLPRSRCWRALADSFDPK